MRRFQSSLGAEEQLCTVVCVAAMPKRGQFNELMSNNVTTALDLLPLLLTMATAGTNMGTKQSPARKFLLFGGTGSRV